MQVAGLHKFALDDPIGLQLGCVGSHSKIVHGMHGLVQIGAVDEEDLECVLGHPEPDASSSSEPLSQASSSVQSDAEYVVKRLDGFKPM